MHFAEGSGLSTMPTKALPLKVFFRNFICSLKVLLAILCRRFFKTKGFLLEFLTFLQAVPFWYFFLAVSSWAVLNASGPLLGVSWVALRRVSGASLPLLSASGLPNAAIDRPDLDFASIFIWFWLHFVRLPLAEMLTKALPLSFFFWRLQGSVFKARFKRWLFQAAHEGCAFRNLL